jgi:hypothetical protein
LQQSRRGFAYVRKADDSQATEAKMLLPLIPPWMKQWNQLLAAIERPDIRSFVPVTEGTAVSQIVQGRPAAMLFADDMIHLATPETVVLMYQAIFAVS